MAPTKGICHKCRQPILNWPYTLRGEQYCYECFMQQQSELEEEEAARQVLYSTIKRIFCVSEVPQDVITAIDRELKNGRKISGLEATIRYYYEIMGHPVTSVSNVGFVLRDQYDNARRYAEEVAQIMERNQDVDLSAQSVTVRVTPESLYPSRSKKIPYRIEDIT